MTDPFRMYSMKPLQTGTTSHWDESPMDVINFDTWLSSGTTPMAATAGTGTTSSNSAVMNGSNTSAANHVPLIIGRNSVSGMISPNGSMLIDITPKVQQQQQILNQFQQQQVNHLPNSAMSTPLQMNSTMTPTAGTYDFDSEPFLQIIDENMISGQKFSSLIPVISQSDLQLQPLQSNIQSQSEFHSRSSSHLSHLHHHNMDLEHMHSDDAVKYSDSTIGFADDDIAAYVKKHEDEEHGRHHLNILDFQPYDNSSLTDLGSVNNELADKLNAMLELVYTSNDSQIKEYSLTPYSVGSEERTFDSFGSGTLTPYPSPAKFSHKEDTSSSCHHCKRRRKPAELKTCTRTFEYKKELKACKKRYCLSCISKYPQDAIECELPNWICMACKRICKCAACRRKPTIEKSSSAPSQSTMTLTPPLAPAMSNYPTFPAF